MLKNFLVLLIGFLLILNLNGCGGGGGDSAAPVVNNTPSLNTKYLASNIIFSSDTDNIAVAKSSNKSVFFKLSNFFNFNIIKTAFAESEVVDTNTQILASNVIIEDNLDSQIESDNVQDALEEISLKLSVVIVGTWNIQNFNQEDLHLPTGHIEIYDDETFDLIEGSFAAIGMGSGEGPPSFMHQDGDGFCSHTEENQIYKIYTEDVIVFTHFNRLTENSVIPRLIKLRENEIVFVGSGGCGQSSRQRISILTRVE
ncbi:MAG: hypothetical protein HN737_02245 [Desulfobacterales bacterium]|nr:hypothetical protein [Desulfobacteraceae bacterium]MBT4363677.1 hypothetical protein [Desulfobacteraceae bacterium]MBT7085078.1 hypothetical protein [Desulfobacterales bacterium]MBT7696210.1 hypothetical protein [Desulfobacterales bacterium]